MIRGPTIDPWAHHFCAPSFVLSQLDMKSSGVSDGKLIARHQCSYKFSLAVAVQLSNSTSGSEFQYNNKFVVESDAQKI